MEVIEWLRSDNAGQPNASGAEWGAPAHDAPLGARTHMDYNRNPYPDPRA